ncbi:MAG TPA: hypothetical protein VE266_09430, partial [Steroidobacteraceae bacterium]|nr:hypothetical protein [Steroidobacteraceae bacterium]
MKRIVLFIVTNLAVLLILTTVARLLGLDTWLAEHGESLGGLLVWAALFGVGLGLSLFTGRDALRSAVRMV